MMVGLNRGRRPPPIQIPKHERRQDGEIDSRETPTRKTSPFPTATSSILTSRVVLRPSIVSQPNEATTPALSPQRTSTRFSTRLTPKPERGTSLELSIPTQPPTTTSNPTPSQSPTKTTFVTVTQSVGSPKEKQETPGATKTVFVSGIPEVVTVTAPAQATDPSSLNSGTSKTQEQSALPLGAVKPLIALGVIGGVSAIVMVVIILWRRRRKRKEKLHKESAEQHAMTEANDSGFQVIQDTRPILG